MAKTATIHMRVEPELKESAEDILKCLGLTTSDAINMMLNQVVLRRGLPFDVSVPLADAQNQRVELKAVKLG